MASTSSYLANLPQLPKVTGTDPERCILDSFRTAIAQIVADALPPLTVEQVYTGVDYGKKGVDFTAKHKIIPEVEFRKLDEMPQMYDEMERGVATKVWNC